MIFVVVKKLCFFIAIRTLSGNLVIRMGSDPIYPDNQSSTVQLYFRYFMFLWYTLKLQGKCPLIEKNVKK